MFMHWLKRIYKDMQQRKKLKNAGFEFIKPKNCCTISLKKLCEIFHGSEYYIWLRNTILRAAKKEPKKFHYILLSMEKDKDLCFTVEGLREFQDIFTEHFDRAGFQYLCQSLSEIDKRRAAFKHAAAAKSNKTVQL